MSSRDRLLDERIGRREVLPSMSSGELASLLDDAPALAAELLREPQPQDRLDARLVYRSVSAVLSEALLRSDEPLFSRGVASLLKIYRLGDPRADLPTRTPDFEASLWESIVIELFAVGGLAVDREAWTQVRELTSQQPHSNSEAAYDRSWLRHGQVASSRSSLDPADSIPHIASRRLAELRDGITATDALALVCRFDLVAALLIEEAGGQYYPNAAACSESLVEPLVVDHLRQIHDPLRAVVFAGNDEGVREALRKYNEDAVAEAAYHRARSEAWEWRGFADGRTWLYIRGGQLWEDWNPGSQGWS